MRFRVPAPLHGIAPSLVLTLMPLASMTIGCAHADSAADRHIVEMREVIGKVQADQDRANLRADILERGPEEPAKPTASSARPPAPATAAAGPRSIQLGEGDETYESDDPDDPSARPEIRLQGTPGVGRPSRVRSSRSRDDRLERDDTARPDGPRSSVLDPDAKRAYDAALAQVHDKQYERALESLSAFLVRWPDHPYAENATYWRGECYFARGEYLKAAEQFEAAVVRYGGAGAKAPDALLKMGMAHDRLGSPERAKEYWERLRRDYPRSDAAKKIPQGVKSDTRGGPSGPKESR